jgi:hypothetical protein
MTGPTDWTSGERVFAPPNGVLDVDWLVPAVLDGVPGATPDDARTATRTAWSDHRAGRPADRTTALRARAADVVADAVRAFDA